MVITTLTAILILAVLVLVVATGTSNYILGGGSDTFGSFFSQNCRDSDSGLNTLRIGTCSDSKGTFTDYCSDKNHLVEYWCNQATKLCKSYTYACGSGCSNGACARTSTTTTRRTTTPKCTDTDNGYNLGVKGTCTDSQGSHTDYCNNIYYITEYSCNSQTGMCDMHYGIRCLNAGYPNGYCHDDACLSSECFCDQFGKCTGGCQNVGSQCTTDQDCGISITTTTRRTTTTTTPPNPATPTISITPISVVQGNSVTVTGSGFTPNGNIEMYISIPGANLIVSPYYADGSGGLNIQLLIGSNVPKGQRPVWAHDVHSGKNSNHVTITVLSSSTTTTIPSTTTTSQQCTGWQSCWSCTYYTKSTGYCGWCKNLNTCKHGTQSGPDDGSCSYSDWVWLSGGCTSPTSTTTTTTMQKCKDSDSGLNTIKIGTCSDSKGTFTDYCSDKGHLVEYWCTSGTNLCQSSVYGCACSNGVC